MPSSPPSASTTDDRDGLGRLILDGLGRRPPARLRLRRPPPRLRGPSSGTRWHSRRLSASSCSTIASPPSSEPSYSSTSRRRSPWGPPTWSERAGIGVSSATVRNEMTMLEREGYLAQPHTSAGRIPTEKGYRFFVDALEGPAELGPAQVRQVRAFFSHAHGELEQMLRDTSQMLSKLTATTAVVVGEAGESATDPVGAAGGAGPRTRPRGRGDVVGCRAEAHDRVRPRHVARTTWPAPPSCWRRSSVGLALHDHIEAAPSGDPVRRSADGRGGRRGPRRDRRGQARVTSRARRASPRRSTPRSTCVRSSVCWSSSSPWCRCWRT